MSAEPLEQEEEKRSARRKPVLVKLRPSSPTLRLVGCPAYPATGLMAGATVEWCRTNRGRIPACAACQWQTA